MFIVGFFLQLTRLSSSRNQVQVDPTPSAWKGFLRARSWVSSSAPPHNSALAASKIPKQPGPPVKIGLDGRYSAPKISWRNIEMKFHVCCGAKICFARLIRKEFLFFRLFWRLGNQNWGPFRSFLFEFPQKPCFFLFSSSQSKTSGLLTWKTRLTENFPVELKKKTWQIFSKKSSQQLFSQLKGLAFFSKEEAAQYDWRTVKKFCNLVCP